MPPSDVVTEYLDALARELSFDPRLSRRVRREVEDHLWEAAATEPGGETIEVQRRAIAKFGDPREIARQYAALSAFAQTRRIGVIVALALAGVFIAMKGRGIWYRVMQWGLSDQTEVLGAMGVSVARCAFAIALAVGIVGCAYIATRRAPTAVHRAYGEQMNYCVMLCMLVAGALFATVLVDAFLTTLHLLESGLSTSALVPILSTGMEVGLLSLLILGIRAALRRTAAFSSFLHA